MQCLKDSNGFVVWVMIRVIIKSDSLLTVRALQQPPDKLLEVGFILEACRSIFDSRPGFSISIVKRQANMAAHLVAQLPCYLSCHVELTSSSNMLLETLIYDVA